MTLEKETAAMLEHPAAGNKRQDYYSEIAEEIQGKQLGTAVPAYSEEFLALRFADRYHSKVRYVEQWGCWMFFDGHRWAKDKTLRIFNLVRSLCRDAAKECNETRTAASLATAKTVAAVERLSKSDRRLAATVEQWDSDPWLLNTPDGVINLRTGISQKPDPELYMTKITAVCPGGDCTTFKNFLRRITGKDEELQAYLQRMLGYTLTGITTEHALFFLYGTGRNGKSVLLNTVSNILDEYHVTAPVETFTASTTAQHPTDLAGLMGARLVTATETEEGRRWAESRIKSLTGGDKIAARFMRQDYFQYTPQFKLIIAGNHKPGLRAVDQAIRRRFNLVPFAVTIPEQEQDRLLEEKLKAEWSGILQWMIEGCLQWQQAGLNPPEAVTRATNDYMEAEDAHAAWLEETCILSASEWESSAAIFGSWKSWAITNGEPEGTPKRLAQVLETRGLSAVKQRGSRGFQGITLKQKPTHWLQKEG